MLDDPKESHMTSKANAIPQYHELFNPLLQALKELGGTATVTEIEKEFAKDLV